ncbi:zinc-dependent metalloprotease [Rapidithrix thailandica]|uniref:Zinc-dependent metalloprotease n=1 Tax=Rapidithrix thailandica TaxID=413964 RepID=A0AAW9SDP0_9BACT
MKNSLPFTILSLLLLFFNTATAQKQADLLASQTYYQGLVDFYYDSLNDKIYFSVSKSQLNEEILYIHSLATGVGSNDIGLDRGQLGAERIVKFEKAGNKLLLVQPNYKFRAKSNNAAEVAAMEQAFAQSILWGFKIEQENSGRYLIDATNFLLRDAHGVSRTLARKNQGNYALDLTRSAFYLPRTKNFPKNTEFEVTLTFTGKPEGRWINSVTPNAEAVTVRQHHSFVSLPDNNYQARKFDPRAGYFSMAYYDYAVPLGVPLEQKFIARHRLEKKDPKAKVSEPVKPIVYYLDPGTPEPIRSALLDGARWWNQAFEAIGYKEAFQVKMLPDGADPMDVRYNMIQWVHRSTRGWSYGASVIDPRTGEIIKGHVTLGSLRVRQDYLIAEGLLAPYKDGEKVPDAMEKMALARLRQLSAHEVGHTLGLAHSYASSTEGRASVMDYPHPYVFVKGGKIVLDNAYDDRIGAWDKVAIAYGYQDFPEGTDENKALNDIISASLKEGLTFLSDQDARPQGSAHPNAHLWDNGKDVVAELERMMEIRKIALTNFGEEAIRKGEALAKLEEVLTPLYFFHRYQTEAVAKVLGGLEYRYALRGDGQFATKMIDPEWQKRALESLVKTLDPSFLALNEELMAQIPPRPMGSYRNREIIKVKTGMTFDPLSAAESAADMTLSLLLHPERANRLVEYHARNEEQPGLEYVIKRLIKTTIMKPFPKNFEKEVQMTIDNVVLQKLMELAVNPKSSNKVKAIAHYHLDLLKEWLEDKAEYALPESKVHYGYGLKLIKAFEKEPEKYKVSDLLPLPDGSPIGMEWGCGQ